MEKHFVPIEDAARLKAGDIIVVPSEIHIKHKRLHASLNTFSRMGLSIGFTSRSDNRPFAVKKLLGDDPGHSRVLFVSDVYCGYSGGFGSGLLPFIGNKVTETPTLPVVQSARIYELPYGDKCSRYARLLYLSSLAENAHNVLLGKISNLLYFWNVRGIPETRKDACISEVYNSHHSREDLTVKDIAQEVPCSGGRNNNAKMTRDEIAMFLSKSRLFDAGYASTVNDVTNDFVHVPIKVTKKFLVEYARRGALFYRPSEEVLNVIMARALVESFKEYIDICNQVTESAEFFAKNLGAGIDDVAAKIKEAKNIEEYLVKLGENKDIMNQLKEIAKCK